MPARDGTGPWGRGPGTGKGFGPCSRGTGFGRGYFTPAQQPTKEQEIEYLKQEKQMIEKRLKELEKE
jgi:hypothetical protein